mmetsp:Transcript_17000/g.41743  ORF Transcript_17000/g.41743 Transcript_17000/m.41743 type:complete len:216 (+) Transcript_17000:891-1538(+)
MDWATGSQLGSRSSCLDPRLQFKNCNESQVYDLNLWYDTFVHELTARSTFSRKGNGAFIESCLEHVAAENSGPFNNYRINETSINEALTAWWNSDGNNPAEMHTYKPCRLVPGIDPVQCMNSCFTSPQPSSNSSQKPYMGLSMGTFIIMGCIIVVSIVLIFMATWKLLFVRRRKDTRKSSHVPWETSAVRHRRLEDEEYSEHPFHHGSHTELASM